MRSSLAVAPMSGCGFVIRNATLRLCGDLDKNRAVLEIQTGKGVWLVSGH